MNILGFNLAGDIGFWRDFEDSVGNLTCLGPAPSHILGIIAASFGWSSTNQSHNQKGRAPWPYATQLLSWVEANEPKVAARLLSTPSRIALSVNGFKNAKTLENTRIQQTVLENPIYQIAVRLPTVEETETLQAALKKPAFRICLGSQFCPGFIRELAPLSADTKANWALFSPNIGADSTPLSLLDLTNPKNRVHKNGYWNYLPQDAIPLETALQDAFYRT